MVRKDSIHPNIIKNLPVNYELKLLTKSLAIDDRIEKMQEAEAYITVNDHKESFPHKLSLRLINPSKSDIGKINKKLLGKTNDILIVNTNVNRWKNTRTVID